MGRRGATLAALGTLAVACLVAPSSSALDIPCGAGAPGGSWTSDGQSPSSARVQPQERDVKPPLLPLWTFDTARWSHVRGQQLVGQPVVDAGCAYLGSHRGTAGGRDLPGWVYAVSTTYGEAVWQRPLEGGVRSALALTRDLVLAHVQGRSGPTVVALDRRTGATRWQTVVSRAPGARALASPVVTGRTVWVGVAGPQGTSALLDLVTGRLLRSTATAGTTSSATVDERTRTAYVPTAAGVLAVDVDRSRGTFGRVVARGPRVATTATPNLVGGAVASLGDDGVLRLLRRPDLRAVSQVLVAATAGQAGATATLGGAVFGSTQTPGALWSVDAATGSLRWLTPVGDADHRLTPVSLANGVVYAVDQLGALVAADAATGLLLWKLPVAAGSETYAARTLSSAGVTIAEHQVLVATGERDRAEQDGFLVAYGPTRLSL